MDIEEIIDIIKRIENEVGKVIVGQKDIIRSVVVSLIIGGHVLIEGLPGLGKTLLIKTLGEVLDLKFSRIQFTPDLMPADIIGTDIIEEGAGGEKKFVFHEGPVFANLVLADEINRATPKTQSALLEAMQEKSVTSGKNTRKLNSPFFVMATQNPIEMEGTYPLPEAQLDRFIFKLLIDYPSAEEMVEIIKATTSKDITEISCIIEGEQLLEIGSQIREVPVASHVMKHIVELVLATNPGTSQATDLVNNYVRFGSSPRGAQAIALSAKVYALLDGRFNVSFDDVNDVAAQCLRHRIILNYEAEAEGITTDQIINEIIKSLKTAVLN